MSPRSVCIYAAPTAAALDSAAGSTNPFDMASGGDASSSSSSPQTPHAVVFGSEQGSLHYRTYPSPNPSSNGSSSNAASSLQPPLGVTPSGRPPMNLPRGYFPVDLPRNSLPGPVVGVVPAKGLPGTSQSSHQQQQHQPPTRPVFLVLVDDNRGSNHQGYSMVHLAN